MQSQKPWIRNWRVYSKWPTAYYDIIILNQKKYLVFTRIYNIQGVSEITATIRIKTSTSFIIYKWFSKKGDRLCQIPYFPTSVTTVTIQI